MFTELSHSLSPYFDLRLCPWYSYAEELPSFLNSFFPLQLYFWRSGQSICWGYLEAYWFLFCFSLSMMMPTKLVFYIQVFKRFTPLVRKKSKNIYNIYIFFSCQFLCYLYQVVVARASGEEQGSISWYIQFPLVAWVVEMLECRQILSFKWSCALLIRACSVRSFSFYSFNR